MQFSNGSTATHNLLQGTVLARRLIRIVGTKGEIEGSIDSSKFTVYTYDFDNAWCKSADYDVNKDIAQDDHHAGGDAGTFLENEDYEGLEDGLLEEDEDTSGPAGASPFGFFGGGHGPLS